MKKKKVFTLSDEELKILFDKFSHPITKSAITDVQKEKSLAIAKLLWLLFITQTDSELNVYNILNNITSNNHENTSSIGALYFHKMKKALETIEATRLYNHFRSIENFNKLEDWGISPNTLKEFH